MKLAIIYVKWTCDKDSFARTLLILRFSKFCDLLDEGFLEFDWISQSEQTLYFYDSTGFQFIVVQTVPGYILLFKQIF